MKTIVSSRMWDSLTDPNNPVEKILDFGQHPYADTFIEEDRLDQSEPLFPLEVYLDKETGMIQLGVVSDAKTRYNLYNYSYTSANSVYSRNHWDEYFKWTMDNIQPSGTVVEIGSNDGFLINQFHEEGLKTIGIDSSKFMTDLARSNYAGPTFINDVWTKDTANQIDHGIDLIIANNVLNHSNNPIDFIRGVFEVLRPNGMFMFELPYWFDSVRSLHLDQVYHEHITYFTLYGAYHLLRKAGMELVDFQHNGYHGGSIRVIATKGSSLPPTEIQNQIINEMEYGLFDVRFYENLQRELEIRRSSWLADFHRLKSDTHTCDNVVIGVGAAAKANTWLNWHGLNKTHIKYITDSSPFKQGKYTPHSRIPIVGDEIFAEYDSPYALILSWNIGQTLKDILLDINPNVRFLTQ